MSTAEDAVVDLTSRSKCLVHINGTGYPVMSDCFSHFYNWHGIGMHFTLSILCAARSSEGGFCRAPESFGNQTVTSIPALLPGRPTRADDSSGRHSHLSPRPLLSHGGSNVPGCQRPCILALPRSPRLSCGLAPVRRSWDLQNPPCARSWRPGA